MGTIAGSDDICIYVYALEFENTRLAEGEKCNSLVPVITTSVFSITFLK